MSENDEIINEIMITVLGENLYTVVDVAEMLGTTSATVAGYVKSGRLKAVRIAGRWHINEANLKSFINPD